LSTSPYIQATADVHDLRAFDAIIDVRTPAEFAEDHIPGAVNRPVLSDEERARVGTIYKQISTFDGRKIGAALVSRNIAHHIEQHFAQQPRTWRPLIYCWRGGKRSDAMVHILSEIGWDAHRLAGGYRAYRRTVVAELPRLARRFDLRVICGLTGSGKSRLLLHLERLGAQVLDLERMAAHRGSVLGNLPGQPQPAQKMFESRIWAALSGLDPARPVFVESESKRIGALHIPDELMAAMWASPCVRLECEMALRVQLLCAEYQHFVTQPDALGAQLDCLIPLHGRAGIERWKQMAGRGQFDGLVTELLEQHYDPAYARSILKHYPGVSHAPSVRLADSGEDSFNCAARHLITLATAQPVQAEA
jgi:tRNA 2-selenouridine synthase